MSEQQAAVAKSRMPKELKAKWLEALRSGKYKQGKSRLYTPSEDSYCCLGVLQQVADGRVEDCGLPTALWSLEHGCFNEDMTRESFAPIVLGHKSVAGMNDTGYSFSEIADLIEGHVEGV